MTLEERKCLSKILSVLKEIEKNAGQGGGGGLIEPGTPGNLPMINIDGTTLVDGLISQSELASIIELIGTWDPETVEMVKDASKLSYYLNIIIGYSDMPTFSTTERFEVGELALYNRKLYRFTQSHLGPWDATHAVETSFYLEFLRIYFGLDLTEHVYITLSFTGTIPSFTGKTITVTYDSTPHTYNISNDGKVDFLIDKGKNYVISFPVFTDYALLSDRSFVSVMNRRDLDIEYQTVTSMTETVKIYTHLAGSQSVPTGNVTVTNLDTSVITTYPLDATGYCTFTFPYTTHYKILFPDNTGYITPAEITKTANINERVISRYYLGSASGLFFVDSAGTLYTSAEWQAAGKAASEAKFIYCNTEALQIHNASFYINVDDLKVALPSKLWLSANVLVTTLQNYGSAAAARQDFNLDNTEKLAQFIEESATPYTSELVDYVHTKDITMGSLQYTAYCGTAALWDILASFYSDLVTMLTIIEVANPLLMNKTIWTSTQGSSTTSWYLYYGSLLSSNKNTNYSVLCFYAL